jgi:polyisoprenoid-binding protein YceI
MIILLRVIGILFIWMAVCMLTLPLPAAAALQTFLAPQGQVSSLMIFEQTGFARVYGIFKEGIARYQYDDQLTTLDDLKLALLMRSFTSASPRLEADMLGRTPLTVDKEREVAFIQTEPARFDNGKAKVKGQLIINNVKKDVVMEAELNKYGRISQTTDVMEEGKSSTGISMHVSIKRSDYSLSMDSATSPFNDDVVLMIDVVGQR